MQRKYPKKCIARQKKLQEFVFMIKEKNCRNFFVKKIVAKFWWKIFGGNVY